MTAKLNKNLFSNTDRMVKVNTLAPQFDPEIIGPV